MAGFGHVVAAMWTSKDDVCVEMATKFYEDLRGDLRGGHMSRHIAEAMGQIRSRWRRVPLNWTPYIHVGA